MTNNLMKDPLLRLTVYNKGCLGNGIHKCCVNGKLTKKYKVWYDMLMRCYSKKYQNKNPTYIGCIVDNKWLNYQVFAEWFEDNYIEGYELDKDILVKGNKIYSPKTCCFVPHSINSLIVTNASRRGVLPMGVTITKSKRYRAILTTNQTQIYLGTFDTSTEAFNIYVKAKKQEIIRQSNLYKNTLNINCYTALINYNINITD